MLHYPWDSSGKNTGVGCHSLLQGYLPDPGIEPGSSPIAGFPGGSDSKESAYNVGSTGLIPGSGRYPWRWEQQPIPIFLPGEFHGQRSLADYGSLGYKKSDMAERLTLCYIDWSV